MAKSLGYNSDSSQVVALTSADHMLSDQQKIFVKQILAGRGPNIAARMAGYASPDIQGNAIMKSPKIQAAIRSLYKKYEKAADMDRKRVLDGFLEAIEMAKIQADAGTMVAGWREIGRMCGYYAPEVKKIEISVSAKRVIDQMETLSDEDLMKMVEESAQILEGEAIRVLGGLESAENSEETLSVDENGAEKAASA